MTANLPPAYWLDQCRAELAQAKANLCGHGVNSKTACGECEADQIRADLKRRRDEAGASETETATTESEKADE